MKTILKIFKHIGAVGIIFLMITAASAQDAGVKSALHFLDIGQPNKAIELLKLNVSTRSDASWLYYYLGYAQLKAGEYEKAGQSFDKGISIDEKDGLNYAGKGHLAVLKKNAGEARTYFDRALAASKSREVPVMQAIARGYLEDNQFTADALALLDRAKMLDNQNAETFLLLGDAYLKQNNGGSAVSSYEWAAQYDPRNAKAHYLIGIVYEKSMDYAIAEESFKKAVSADPQFGPAYRELAELSYLKKDGVSAANNYAKYLELTEKPEKGKVRYAFYLLMAKDFAKANEVFKSAVMEPDASPVALRYYAHSLYESGNYTESKNILDQYIAKADQKALEATDFALMGKLLIKMNQDSLGIVNLQKSLAMDKAQPGLLQLEADILFKQKKYSEVIESYRRLTALGHKPVSAELYSLGRALFMNKQYMEADTTFLKLIDLQPNMTVGYLWEARVKSNLDPESENGLAKPYYQKLVEVALPSGDKYRKELIEAYSYLGYYHFLKKELALSRESWSKVQQLDPQNEKAREALKAIP